MRIPSQKICHTFILKNNCQCYFRNSNENEQTNTHTYRSIADMRKVYSTHLKCQINNNSPVPQMTSRSKFRLWFNFSLCFVMTFVWVHGRIYNTDCVVYWSVFWWRACKINAWKLKTNSLLGKLSLKKKKSGISQIRHPPPQIWKIPPFFFMTASL